MRGLKFFAAIVIALALAACSIASETRLIPLQDALAPFPKKSILVGYSDTDKPQKFVMERDGRSYRILPPADQSDEKPVTVTFFALPGVTNAMIVELDSSEDGKTGFIYALGRLDGDTLAVASIKTTDGLEAYGEITGGKYSRSLLVRTRKNLEAAMKQLIARPDELATKVANYRVFDASDKKAVAAAEAFHAERLKLAADNQ